MNYIKIFSIAALGALTLNACDDDKMSWGRDADWGEVDPSELPVELAEQISRYDFIKKYVTERGLSADFQVGIGMGADKYIAAENVDFRATVDNNFNTVTFGNAMKYQSVVKTSGEFNFSTIDTVMKMLPADMKVYGHNLLWHTQQQSAYLKSLIAPKQEVTIDKGDV